MLILKEIISAPKGSFTLSFSGSMTWRNTPPVRFVQCACYVFKCFYTAQIGLVIVVSIDGWLCDRVNDIHLAGPAGRSLAAVGDSNPSGGVDVCLLWVFCVLCFVLSGRGLCDGLITRPEESYRLWCVVVCYLETSWMRRPWPTGGCCGFEFHRGHGCLLWVLCVVR